MKAAVVFLLTLCYLALGVTAWNCVQGPYLYQASQIDAGQGIMVATDRHFWPYILFGRHWRRISAIRFRHLSAGPSGIWGAGLNHRVYKYLGRGRFQRFPGHHMKQVDAGGRNHIVGASTSNRAYCIRPVPNFSWGFRLRWTNLNRRLRYYSCSPRSGCWGVARNFQVYHTKNVNSATCSHTGWTLVRGRRFKMIEVGTDGTVLGVTRRGQVYQRRGFSRQFPYGRRWFLVPMCLKIKHVTYDRRRIWAVTHSGTVMTCT